MWIYAHTHVNSAYIHLNLYTYTCKLDIQICQYIYTHTHVNLACIHVNIYKHIGTLGMHVCKYIYTHPRRLGVHTRNYIHTHKYTQCAKIYKYANRASSKATKLFLRK